MKFINEIATKIGCSNKLQLVIFVTILVAMTSAMMTIYSPLFEGYDIHFHFERFKALIRALDNGNYPFYINYEAIDGYGYLTNIFYADLILVPFALLALATSPLVGYQVMLFAITFFCGICTFVAMKRISGNYYIATVGALLYTFAFYRLIDLYARAAIGESIAFTFVPIVLWGLYEIIKGDYKKWYILTIGFTLLIYSHAISSFIMCMAVAILLAIGYKSLIKDPKRIKYLFVATCVTILLVAFYCIPILEQLSSNTFYFESESKRIGHESIGATPRNILFGYFLGIHYSGAASGTGVLLTFVIFLRLFIYKKPSTSTLLTYADIFLILGLLFTFCISNLYPWHTFPFSMLKIVQISWRFCLFISLFYAIAGAIYLSDLLTTHKRKIMSIGAICGFIIITMASNCKSLESRSAYDSQYPSVMGNSYNQIGMEYLPEKIPTPAHVFFYERGTDSINIDNNKTEILNLKRNKGELSFVAKTSLLSHLELPLIYYKGYEASINNTILKVNESENGLVKIAINENGIVKIKYKGTAIQKLSFMVSIATCIALCAYMLLCNSKKRKQAKQ